MQRKVVGASQASTRVRFWGVRGSIPTPGPSTVRYGGNTSCVEIRADGQIIILDAGTGLRPLGLELIAEFDNQPLDLTLLLSHTHWDHIQGLPFFQPVYRANSRLRILGYEGARRGLDSVLSEQMESPFFPIGLREVPSNIRIEELKDLSFKIGPVRVDACFAHHPGTCVGYRLFTSGGSICFFPDNEPHYGYDRSRKNSAKDPKAVKFAEQQEQQMIDFIRGAEVLIIDAQYDRDEYPQHMGWGHGCLDHVVNLAVRADVKKLFLFHHDPAHDDKKISDMVAYARKLGKEAKSSVQVNAAQEGVTIELASGKSVPSSAQKRAKHKA